MNAKNYAQIGIGDSASFSKTVTEYDVYQFAGVTGDFNPVHVNTVAAEESQFKHRIAHGILSAGFVSTVIGTQLPGPGTIYLSQQLKFRRPVYFGDTITTTVTVAEKLEKKRVRLLAICRNQNGDVVSEGESVVIAP